MTEEIYRRLCNIYLCMWFENLIADPQFDTLQFTRDEWVAFVQGVKAGEFDGSE